MGKASRDKGSRRERELVHSLQASLIAAKRVPLSGAAIGYKGDVEAILDGKSYLIEVKARATDYDRIYELFDLKEDNDGLGLSLNGECVYLSLDFRKAIKDSFMFDAVGSMKLPTKFGRTVRKLINMKKLLGEADLLAIRADRKPWLYIVYR